MTRILMAVLMIVLTSSMAQAFCKGGEKSRAALTSDTLAILEGLEAYLGQKVKIIGTCVVKHIAGRSRMSEHAYGRAVDAEVKPSLKRKALSWLRDHVTGVLITYSDSSHIHFDTGKFHGVFAGRPCYCHRKNDRSVMAYASSN